MHTNMNGRSTSLLRQACLMSRVLESMATLLLPIDFLGVVTIPGLVALHVMERRGKWRGSRCFGMVGVNLESRLAGSLHTAPGSH